MFSTKFGKTHAESPGDPDKRISDAARALQVREVPAELRTKTVAAFTARTADTAPPESRLPRRVMIGGVAATIVGAAVILSGPRGTSPVSAASIADAIGRTNTWHLSGWRLKNGIRLRWEVWGRRQPFFYREQIGQEIVSDDGTTRVHVLPPQRMHPRGMVIIMPTRPLHTTQNEAQKRTATYDTTAFLAGTSGDYAGEYTLQPTTDGSLLLNGPTVSQGYTDEQVRLTADRKTRLPTRYELTLTQYKNLDRQPGDGSKIKQFVKATLDAKYNVPMPQEILQGTAALATSMLNYQRIDLTATPETPTGPEVGIARQGGITIACETLNRDAEGNLRLKYQVWLGDVQTGTWGGQLKAHVRERDRSPRNGGDTPLPTDAHGNAYLYLNAPDADSGDRRDGYSLGYYAIATPRPVNDTPELGLLTLPLRVQVHISEDDEEKVMDARGITEENLTVQVPLPAEVSSLGYDRPRPQMPGLSWHLAGEQLPLRLVAAWQRGVYWKELGTGRNVLPNRPPNRRLLRRAKEEYATALAEAERIANKSWTKDLHLSLKSVENELAGKR